MNTDGPPVVFSPFWIGLMVAWGIVAAFAIALAVVPANQPLPIDEWASYPVNLMMSLHP